MSDENITLALLVNAREALKMARSIKCTCSSSIGLMKDGCGCGRGSKIKAAEKHLWDLIEDL